MVYLRSENLDFGDMTLFKFSDFLFLQLEGTTDRNVGPPNPYTRRHAAEGPKSHVIKK